MWFYFICFTCVGYLNIFTFQFKCVNIPNITLHCLLKVIVYAIVLFLLYQWFKNGLNWD